jgi:hypothetical protein
LAGLQVTSGDGAFCDGHPIFATYVGDHPEQVLVTFTKKDECPTCPTPHDEMGNPETVGQPRELLPILEALDTVGKGSTAFNSAYKAVGIKPVQAPVLAS